MENEAQLRLRLKNCLQIILDFKDDFGAMSFGVCFMTEFNILEGFLQKIAGLSVSEYEVRRVELATTQFLEELNHPLFSGRAFAVHASHRVQ
ncbi:MAG: hypothetical protein LBD82_04210 [Deltaproteobacteria bacterium]|nr:hypothetical protein [Deltaproteobacteria bacterium]